MSSKRYATSIINPRLPSRLQLLCIYVIFSEKRCPKCDFLTQRDGWMYGKPNFDDIHPRAGLAKINEECAKCQVRCGFKTHPIDFED